MKQKHLKILDIILLITLPLAAVGISLVIQANYLLFTLLYFLPLIIYLSCRTPKVIMHVTIFSLIIALFGVTVVGYLVSLDHAWYVATIFPFRILGAATIEELLWSFLCIYLIVIFHEHFFDKGKHKPVESHMRYLVYIITALLLFFLINVYMYSSQLLKIPYFYFWFDIVALLIPLLLFLISFPSTLSKFLKTLPYFIFLGIIHELTSLQLGHWTFPGKHYIGWINILGYKFPYEEFLFITILFVSAILVYYEFFDEDRKKLVRGK